MEYAHAKQFFESVPKRNDVELSKDQQDTPGLAVYDQSQGGHAANPRIRPTRAAKCNDVADVYATAPMGPSVVRTRSETI